MKRVLLLAAFLMAMTALTGCYRTSFNYSDRGASSVTEESQKFLIGGLIGPKKPYRADKLCPSGVAGVETYSSFGNGCIGACTLNIYTPRMVKVTCAAGGAHNFYLDNADDVLAHEFVDTAGNSTVQNFESDVL